MALAQDDWSFDLPGRTPHRRYPLCVSILKSALMDSSEPVSYSHQSSHTLIHSAFSSECDSIPTSGQRAHRPCRRQCRSRTRLESGLLRCSPPEPVWPGQRVEVTCSNCCVGCKRPSLRHAVESPANKGLAQSAPEAPAQGDGRGHGSQPIHIKAERRRGHRWPEFPSLRAKIASWWL